ncbi:amidase [Ranunculus cassubicifolius]
MSFSFIQRDLTLKIQLPAIYVVPSSSSTRADFGILVIPTVPGPPPKLQTEGRSLETFWVRAFSLLSIAGVSGFCQVNIPLGIYDNLPVSISLIAKHGADGFLLNLVQYSERAD